MRPLLIAATGRSFSATLLGRRASDVELRHVPVLPAATSIDVGRPTVIALDRALLGSAGENDDRVDELARRAALLAIGAPGQLEPPVDFPLELLSGYVAADASHGAMLAALRGAFRHAASLVAEAQARTEQEHRRRELEELTRVGVAVSTQRDLLALLEMILTQARRITSSDAGSLYLAEASAPGNAPDRLRFKLSQNFTLPRLPLAEFTVPVDHTSLSGYAASTMQTLVIADVYLLPNHATYKQNRSFDEKFGYHTKSMLVVPLKTHRDDVIGVLQLINRKRDPAVKLVSADRVAREVVPFDQRSVELVTSLASQAAVAIENSRLYEDIERLFEGFVTAAVTAIESRDPATSGHSGRVASLSVALAEAVDRGTEGPYRDTHFTREQLRELRYAGLLHDFGKVGVREQVLVKQKKLHEHDLERIHHRFAFLHQAAEVAYERGRAELALAGRDAYMAGLAALERDRCKARQELDCALAAVVTANEPTVLAEGSFDELHALRRRRYIDFAGVERPLLDDDELAFLMIRQGNLDDAERREIESHVTHTYRFLEQIPWTRELKGIPEIAYLHHEKLNGAGYPRALAGDAIPVQTRMMTIADIFDALTAADRPYKRAVPWERALDILRDEATSGTIDPHLLDRFIGARVFATVLGSGT